MHLDGNFLNCLLGLFIFVFFQVCGMIISFSVLEEKHYFVKILVGSVMGCVMIQWLPCVFALFLGFNTIAHICAMVLSSVMAIGIGVIYKPKLSSFKPQIKLLKINLCIVFFASLSIYAILMFHSFKIADGNIYSSQCTYGDMSMHLGFITSIANQETFPPNYSILCGTKLSYPFLCDSISSSLYIFGMPLRFAYFLPMFFAAAQVMGGFILFMHMWLRKSAKIVIAFILFFFNGGLGFLYFMPIGNMGNFTRIFTQFYETPTNLASENIKWVNTIVDMLIPQRATLFGWALLFTTICILYSAIQSKSKKLFVIAGIFAGAMPMIHTHSFLALALISLMWLACDFLEAAYPKFEWKPIIILLILMPFAMAILQQFLGDVKNVPWLLYLAIGGVAVILTFMLFIVVKNKDSRKIIHLWLIYLLVTLVLALPQLFTWTFNQAIGGHFIRGYFNWCNQGENYLLFYLKNIGITAIIYIPALIFAKKNILKVVSPMLLIMFLSELVVFQPNEYDNNKLIYIAYFFNCGMVADFIYCCFKKARGTKIKWIVLLTTMGICTISALLTMGREIVSSYIVFDKNHVEAATYISRFTQPNDVILTNRRHNNSISALSGRNIVCGSDVYLYFHGLNYKDRVNDIENMYQKPETSKDIFNKYNVSYILISEYEKNDYVINYNYIEEHYFLVYQNDTVAIYSVR